MQDFLHRLRAKPEPVRRQVAFLVTALVGVIVIFFWFASLPDRFTQEQPVAEETGPFLLLGEQIAGAWSEFLQVFGGGTETPKEGVVNLEEYQ